MTKEQALQLLAQAVAQMKLTLQDHQALQQAIKVLADNTKDVG